MDNVKRIFFLTYEEVLEQRKVLNNSLIDHQTPHFELENGEIIWGMIGDYTGANRWYEKTNKQN